MYLVNALYWPILMGYTQLLYGFNLEALNKIIAYISYDLRRREPGWKHWTKDPKFSFDFRILD